MIEARLAEALRDRYAVERLIGEGGMATVHLAEDLKHGRKVALKVLRPELSIAGDRFLREIRVTAGLQHPGIVPLYDSGEAGGLLYYVMPWIEGETLRARLDRERRIPLDEALRIVQIVASTLHYAHERGVVHRDVKPSNILLGAHGTVVVADFGVAHAVQTAGEERLTAIGHSVGTPTYMSPEQASGEEDVDARSDVYALGAMAYEMLSGRPPFEGGSMAALLTKKLTQTAPSLDEVPPEVRRMVQRALETERDKRHASAREFADTVVELLTPRAAATQTVRADGIVVLPFRNLSPDPDNAYFAEGLTEEVTSDLAQLRDLRVISRTTAAQASAGGRPISEVAADLDVAYVLEGSVRKAGNAVRVTVQLVEAATDRQMWSAKFNGTLDDVFEIQERVAADVVRELKGSLSAEDAERIADRRTEDPRILDLIMRVNFEMWRLEKSSFERAKALLDGAKDLVDQSPRLQAAKANVLFQSLNLGFSSDESIVAEAEEMAHAAIRRDPDCALAYSTLAWIVGSRKRQMVEALEYADRAYQLDPGDSTSMLGLIVISGFLGLSKSDSPDLVLERLLESDPLWLPSWIAAVVWHEANGRWDAAVEAGRRGLQLEPSAASAVMLGLAQFQTGDYSGMEEYLRRVEHEPGAWSGIGRAIRDIVRGDFEAARGRIDDEVVAWATPDCQYSWHVANVLALAGDDEGALEWIERAVDNQMYNWRLLGEYDRTFVRLHDHPRFRAAVDRARRAHERIAARWGVPPM